MMHTGDYRIGLGHDTHRLVPGRPLVLAGLRIEHDRGLDGHSDADVVLHAITDALLGAVGLGDIGDSYPDSDPRYRDAASTQFLTNTLALVSAAGWQLVNVDVIIFAEAPKLGPLKQTMAAHLAELLHVPQSCVNVKAKTGERVGHIGRGEAIACQAVVLLQRAKSVAAPGSG
jgi:2-C-methyl-D-erythritol 2,4-cyclodiphosphate synthase